MTPDPKQAAMAFYDLMFNQCRPREAVERFVGEEYIQHNPHVPTARTPSSSTSSGWRLSTPASASSSSVRSPLPAESRNENGMF